MRTFTRSLVLVTTLCSIDVGATEFIVKDINKHKDESNSWIVLPYLFSSDSTGVTGGVIGIANGFLQPQVTMVATAYLGQKLPVQNFTGEGVSHSKANSKGFSFGIDGYKPFFSKRMFVSFLGNYAYFPNQRIYLDGNNDSVKDLDVTDKANFTPFQTQGYNNWAELDFRFVLPFGEGKCNITPIIELDRGIAINRDNQGNGIPFISGQTIFGLKVFHKRFTADKFLHHRELNTNGVRVSLEHDNTDYPDNPSRGYNMKIQTSMDFGFMSSTQSWSAIEARYSYYIELPNFQWSRHNVIAFNTWSAYSPSWNSNKKHKNGLLDKNQPPMWEGARLGGYNRMRAYDMDRFSDKAALYFAAEYRVIPDYNPIKGLSWNPFPIDWFQTVLFAESGRVAPRYDIKELMSDMKYDVGVSLRALTAKVPMRLEVAYGQEGLNMWVMLKQPF